VDYEWDPDKANANFTKHGIHFSDAVSALDDESALSVSILTPKRKTGGSHSAWIYSVDFSSGFICGGAK
jgi:uncharacterized DUF497 family protein